MMLSRAVKYLATSLVLALALPASAGNVEVLHWWTSGGEARSVDSLKQMMNEQGHEWRDFAVPGRAGESAINTLRIRALSGNLPDAAQIKGPDIKDWGNFGFLTNLDRIAKEQGWDNLLPKRISDILKANGHYVAVPFNIHRVNWLWANPAIFKEVGVAVPTTLDDFFIAAEKIKKAGYIPLALGEEPWQEATLFDSIALATLGAADYRRAFVEQDSETLSSEKMREALVIFRKMKAFTDAEAPGRSWNDTTSLVIEGKAAMQVMGDWAKGEFAAEGKIPGRDFICVPAPGTQHQFAFNIDSFVFFKSSDKRKVDSQEALATLIMTPDFQRIFNKDKGSIPVRLDMNLSDFDSCAQNSFNAFTRAAASDQLVPSFSHDMAVGRASQRAMFDVLSQFFNNNNQSIDETLRQLRAAVMAANL
ncbi:ABC transporter substrate-binding protein [Enterovibrio baiacu]|uniref:ABC transporter substrate-binding protein n=1 Tax=Enterovibrio baiacu TaxID=2491023 RepID=UPI003D0CF999